MTAFGLSTLVFGAQPPGPPEFALAASHGFRQIELAAGPGRFDARDLQAATVIRNAAAAASVDLVALSAPLAHVPDALPAARELGCRTVIARAAGCAAHDPGGHAPDRDLSLLRRLIEQAAAGAAGLALDLAVALPPRLRADEAVALMESLDGVPVGLCLDTGHAHLADGVPEAIEALAGYIHTLHVHDNHGREDRHRLPFAGSIEWPAVLMELEKTGYAGPAIFDVTADPDPAATIARAVGARTRLQAILDDLAQPMVFPE
jgi:sugar phosphate isomerase/epimerase